MDERILANARTERKGEKVDTIKFPKSVIRMFKELRFRHSREVNEALQELYDELGVRERIDKQAETGEQIILDPQFTYIEFIMPPKESKDGKESGRAAK